MSSALVSRMDESKTKMLLLINSTFVTAAIKTTVALKVPELLKASGTHLSASEIAARLPLRSKSEEDVKAAEEVVGRMMHALATYGVFEETAAAAAAAEPKFGLNQLSEYLVQDHEECVATPGRLFLLETEARSWEFVAEAVLDGGDPLRMAHGGQSFLELLRKDPKLNLMMGMVMSSLTKRTMKMALERYDGFKNALAIVDVGGGLGTSVQTIKEAYPNVRAINFDLPHVVGQAAAFPGVENVGGDMFHLVPSGDLILLKWILHDWGDEKAVQILKNCHRALPEAGKVVVMEAIFPEKSIDSYSLMDKQLITFDIATLVLNKRAKERTEHEFQVIAGAAGFSSMKVRAKVETISIIELTK